MRDLVDGSRIAFSTTHSRRLRARLFDFLGVLVLLDGSNPGLRIRSYADPNTNGTYHEGMSANPQHRDIRTCAGDIVKVLGSHFEISTWDDAYFSRNSYFGCNEDLVKLREACATRLVVAYLDRTGEEIAKDGSNGTLVNVSLGSLIFNETYPSERLSEACAFLFRQDDPEFKEFVGALFDIGLPISVFPENAEFEKFLGRLRNGCTLRPAREAISQQKGRKSNGLWRSWSGGMVVIGLLGVSVAIILSAHFWAMEEISGVLDLVTPS